MWDLVLKALSGALGGGLLGILGQFLVGWMETRRLDAESARRIAEMRAMADIKTEEAKWTAFTAAQTAAKPSGTEPAWCAAVITLTRPVLTVLLVGFAMYVYSTATNDVRAEMTNETLACCFGAVWFWFGNRYQARISARR